MQRKLMKKNIFFGEIPKFDDVVCLTLLIDSNEKKDKSAKSDFHWQILKCRILIFSSTCILASPVLNTLTHIYLVTELNFWKNDQSLHGLLLRNNLKVLKESKITSYIFETCFKFTISARLAPNWNKVDSFMIEGRDFLSASGLLNGVKYDLKINENRIVLWVEAIKVRLNCFSTEYFEDIGNWQHLCDQIYDVSHYNQWVHVLPSMKRGRVVHISKQLFEQSGFKDYKEMRRHWKNTYGYRLSDSGDATIYLGINFFGTTVFTYPLQCVRTGHTIIFNKWDNTIVLKFINSIKKIFPTVCNLPFHLSEEYGSPVNELLNMKNVSETCHPNWIIATSPGRRLQKSDTPDELCHLSKSEEHSAQELTHLSLEHSESCSQAVSLCTQSQIINEEKRIPFIPKFFKRNIPAPPVNEKINPNPTSVRNSISASNPVEVAKFTNLLKPIKPAFVKPKKVNMFSILKNNYSLEGHLNYDKGKEIQSDAQNFERLSKAIIKPCFNSKTEKMPYIHPTIKSSKRKEANLVENSTKKVRSKQLNTTELEKMAFSGTLDKANVTSLTEFLKLNKIPFKVKDKKRVLIEKVLTHLKNSPNFNNPGPSC